MFEQLLSRISQALTNKKIPYMIIGGQAVLVYGEPRLTKDIDITLGVNTERLNDILQLIKDLPLKLLHKNIKDFVNRTMVLPAIHEDTGIRVDFIFSFTPYVRQAISRSRRIQILGTDVCFASPEDVIIHKVFAGRPRDIEDVRIILLKNPDIDKKYIEKWLKIFDESNESGNFLEIFKEILKNK